MLTMGNDCNISHAHKSLKFEIHCLKLQLAELGDMRSTFEWIELLQLFIYVGITRECDSVMT